MEQEDSIVWIKVTQTKTIFINWQLSDQTEVCVYVLYAFFPVGLLSVGLKGDVDLLCLVQK